jgi:hypothetical protein
MQVLETLKKHQLLANINKFEFSQNSLLYIGYVIGGVKLKIDLSNMEAIMKWLVPINCTKVWSFVGETRYLQKFIASFLAVVAPLHAIIVGSRSFQWGKNQHNAFDELKIVGTRAEPGFNTTTTHQQNPKYRPFWKHLRSR